MSTYVEKVERLRKRARWLFIGLTVFLAPLLIVSALLAITEDAARDVANAYGDGFASFTAIVLLVIASYVVTGVALGRPTSWSRARTAGLGALLLLAAAWVLLVPLSALLAFQS